MKASKRLFDLLLSVPGLIVLILPLSCVALLIKVTDPGPALFLQERVGYRGKPFRLWKFRTMRQRAEADGPRLTVGDDARITPVGRWLRRFKIDELPQLVNVVKGEMSLVGPRPEVAEYVALYDEEQRAVLDLVPGITDPASIKYRNESDLLAASENPIETYVQEIMPDKIRINVAYAARATVATDLVVVLKTVLPLSS